VGVRDGVVMSAASIDVGPDGVRAVQMLLNPEKLAGVQVLSRR
jgi:hypothetical protein